ncbi:LacI family DNA-binding transcriptional regulator [Microbacterium sp.]|uniref:LacI family DNA-binding transcriptional regulator n=1 Tax=Microbacterium sp. TaxID=51671 RepID=UPI0027368F11|nr:LacI family DNA-binding transcriptional regulator [Microbacterium sp.]MDP3950911.1 LacI family DNA-binding transcriptional regulator [Microbacterium sp.]
MARIDEVAKAAGVSISTVSYALSGKRPVSTGTRQRIEDAVQKLGYQANAGARMLAGNRTQIFALTEPFRADTHAPTHMAFVLGASIAARRVGYDILLLTDAEASAGMQRVASSGLVDGIIVLDVAPDDDRVALARSIDIPTVFIGIPDEHAGLLCVDFDFEGAVELAFDKLIAAGHERIGMLGHPEHAYEVSNFPPRARDAFLGRLDAESTERIFVPIETTARAALDALLSAGVTGIILQTTQEAHAEVTQELAERGLRVPDDISLISVGATFDVDSFDTPLDAIPLVPQPSCDRAVELIMQLLEDRALPAGIHLIDPIYTERGSVSHARVL